MSFIRFFFKTLFVSLSVGLRMIPILGITLYSIFMMFIFFAGSELAIYLIGIIIYLPLLMFLYLSAVRAGLAAQRATTAPSFGKLFKASIRVVRFHFMISNLVLTIVAIGGSGLVIWLTTPELIAIFGTDADRSVLLDINVLINDFANIPALILIFPPVALSIAVGLVGTSLGATAAWAAERGPAHDLIWGITSQFGYLFGTAAILLITPTVAFIYVLGGPSLSIWNILFVPGQVYAGFALYSLWAICAVAAAMSIAYVKNLRDLETERVKENMAMMGEAYDPNDIRQLRQSRQAQLAMPAE